MNFKKHILKNKNFKLGYYMDVSIKNLLPQAYFDSIKKHLYNHQSLIESEPFQKRLDYYHKKNEHFSLENSQNELLSYNTLPMPKKSKVYYHDIRSLLKFFDKDIKFLYKPGDNIDVLNAPTFVKSRPIIGSDNEILLKLNAIRHFNFIQDDIDFQDKKGIIFGRLAIYQDVRKRFFQTHFDNPLCDIGDVAHEMNSSWMKPKVSIAEHLKYKYILALEGNDVATNLKWIMSSNSIAIMPQPQFETWFMEGLLAPDHHYISVKDDFSDLDEKINYYNTHTSEALNIIKNAQEWVKQFQNSKIERLLNLQVIEKYARLSGQL